MENNVFNRTSHNSPGSEISTNLYNLVIGLVLCWGFLLNWIMVENIPYETIASINPWLFFLGYIAACFFGITLFIKSDSALVSFIGYNFIVVPFGLIINLVVHQYDPDLVLSAIRVTGLVTGVMMILGTLFPRFFEKIAGALTIALIAVIIVEAVEVFIFKMHHGILDWIVAAIFCGYIGFDWSRANSIPKTLDNAVDSAAALYMDIINLFLRILRIMGRRR
ncbi:MAG: US12 family protein [Kiritimatiellae bacterium]|nr:US12 family protein [Kiritimatiellia bacterium]